MWSFVEQNEHHVLFNEAQFSARVNHLQEFEMQTVLPLLKGRPVLVMRRGVYPNRSEIVDIQASWPGHVVRTENMFNPCRFCITVQRRTS